MMQMGYFNSDTYHTPESEKLTFGERIRFNNRLYFTLRYAKTIIKARTQAVNNKYFTKEWAESSWEIFRSIELCGGKFHITGMENIIKSEEPLLFLSNHMSTLETMVLPCIIAPLKDVTFVVKENLVKQKIFGPVMQSRNPILVTRTDPRKDFEAVMNGGVDLLSKNISIIIFPEGTRFLEFKPENFNSIGVKLAKKAGVKVVPVAIRTDFWDIGKVVKDLGPIDRSKPVHFKFGEPFSVSGNGREDNQRVIDFIQKSTDEWK